MHLSSLNNLSESFFGANGSLNLSNSMNQGEGVEEKRPNIDGEKELESEQPNNEPFSEEMNEWFILSRETEEVLSKEIQETLTLENIEVIANQAVDLADWILVNAKSDSENKEVKSYYAWWATTGGLPAAALALGTAQQIAGNTTRIGFLKHINLLKQIEIKNFAYIMPALPLLQGVAERVYYDESNDSLSEKTYRALAQVNQEELLELFTSILLSLATAGIHGALLRAGVSMVADFSGHVMTKVVSTYLLGQAMAKREQENGPSSVRTAAAAAYSVTDACMMYNTAKFHHTPFELIAGLVWGMANIGVAHYMTDRYLNGPQEGAVLEAPQTLQPDFEAEGSNFHQASCQQTDGA